MTNLRAFVLAIAQLEDAACRCRRLPPPDRRNPEAFHIARDELANELHILAIKLAEIAGTRPRVPPGHAR